MIISIYCFNKLLKYIIKRYQINKMHVQTKRAMEHIRHSTGEEASKIRFNVHMSLHYSNNTKP